METKPETTTKETIFSVREIQDGYITKHTGKNSADILIGLKKALPELFDCLEWTNANRNYDLPGKPWTIYNPDLETIVFIRRGNNEGYNLRVDQQVDNALQNLIFAKGFDLPSLRRLEHAIFDLIEKE